MPRKRLPEGDRAKVVVVMVQEKKIQAIGYDACQDIAKEAIDKVYKKMVK